MVQQFEMINQHHKYQENVTIMHIKILIQAILVLNQLYVQLLVIVHLIMLYLKQTNILTNVNYFHVILLKQYYQYLNYHH